MAAGTLRANDKGLADVLSRWEQLLRFAALRLGRELGADVQVVVSRKEAAEPALRIAAQAQSLVGAGRLSGELRIPAAVAPVDIVADLRAGRVSVAVDVDAPREGRPATRVNWLVRQLKDAPEVLRIDAFAANSRTSTSALLRAVREDPAAIIDDPKRDLRTFRVIATSPLGTKRGVGRGGFIDSVLAALDGFYGSVVQQVRPWAARAPQLPKGGRTAAEEAGLDITPPPEDSVEPSGQLDEELGGVPPEAPIPEPVLEGLDAVEDPSSALQSPDDDAATPEGPAIGDELADEELVSWSEAEDRLEHERHLEPAPDPTLAAAGQGDQEPAPATFDAEFDILEEEKPEEWLLGGAGNESD